MRKIFYLLIFLFSCPFCVCAQNLVPDNSIANPFLQEQLEKMHLQSASNDMVFSCRPFLLTTDKERYDSMLRKEFGIADLREGFIKNTFRYGNMLQYISPDSIAKITLNPLFDFSMGGESGRNIYQKTFGFKLDVQVGQRLFISSSDYESTSQFP